MNAIGERIKCYRKKIGLTQGELARNIGITQSKISAIEKERNYPSLETIKSLKDYFGVSYEWLIEGEDNIILSQKEKELLEYYNKLNEDHKLELIVRGKLMYESQQLKKLRD